MAKKKETKSSVKKKTKQIFNVVAPKILKEVPLGDTYAFSAKDLIGRQIEVNLMNVVMDMRKQHYKIKVIIYDVEGSIAKTKPIGFKMVNSAVKRIVRRSKDKIEDSFALYSKDKVYVRVKPLVITLNNVSASIRTSIRKSQKYYIEKYLKENNFSTFFKAVVDGTFQKELLRFLRKIYPLKNVEMRSMRIEKFRQKIKTADAEVFNQVLKMKE